MVTIPSQEDLKKLSPTERVRRLREIESLKKRELEDTRRQVEQEIAQAEELIRETEESVEEEQAVQETQAEEESLEQRVRDAPAPEPAPQQYAAPLYTTIEQAQQNLERLYDRPDFSERGQELYRESKETIDRVSTYKITSQRLEEELGLLSGMMNRLRYRG